MANDFIDIRGAREHNLKNLNIRIPREEIVVITGLSGSGKSSLAFDTLYAEGQRRYVESLSAYARQFLEQMDKPDVDSIEGLSPAISIEQKTTSRNPRSTVGTVTEIYDYLRVLYARAGIPHCTSCGKVISSQTVTQMTDQLLALDEGSRVEILSPVVRGRKGHYKTLFEQLRKAGFLRVLVDGEQYELEDDIELDKNKAHDIEVVVDRIVIKAESRSRISEALELALSHADGLAGAKIKGEDKLIFSERFACPDCGISLPEMSPRAFSFNSPHGACPECDGLGMKATVDPALIVPDTSLSIENGAVAPWASPTQVYYSQMLAAVAKHFGASIDTPWVNLPDEIKKAILYGTGRQKIEFVFRTRKLRHRTIRTFEGVIPRMERKIRESNGENLDELAPYLEMQNCQLCEGGRLRVESRAVTVGEKAINQLTALSVEESLDFFTHLELDPKRAAIAQRVLKEVKDRLGFLKDVGLGYLTLDRSAGTLSGGESQRIRLATQVGSRLTGVLYILDEPTIGLHHRDNRRLLETLKELKELGNTVVLVEHDEETIRIADHVIDMGPGAGEKGGRVVAEGPPEKLPDFKESLTGAYLSGKMEVAVPNKRREGQGHVLLINGATGHNLKGLDLEIPLGKFTCITGVSGSGKSSLIIDTLLPALSKTLHGGHHRPLPYESLRGVEHVDKVVDVNQSPIGRTPRSNPATYTGLFTHIRDIFARLPEAQVRGFKKGRFSFNVKGGRCEACKGDGLVKIEMHFLPDVYVTCDECGGRRYNRETLEVHYKGASIADVLEMTVSTALDFFRNIPSIYNKLKVLEMVGLGYIKIGQPSTTLSGGEAQRIKLSKELSRRATGRTLYVLDEPTTGLHFDDVRKLLEVLGKLSDAGNTVVVIEHNLDVIKTADHIVDLGPEGGDGGGEIVAEGTPEAVSRVKRSHTGAALKELLGKRGKKRG